MGTKRKTSTPRLPPYLMEEIVVLILARLPVKSLVRFKSVSKAWRSIISDPMFTRAQLRYSVTKWEHDPCFFISPHTLLDRVIPEEKRWPSTFSNHIRFYQWRLGAANQAATFIHAKDFGSEFNQVHYFSHCDGLVFAPTNARLYVFNPATRDSITLPHSDRSSNLRIGGRRRRAACYCTGFGLDLRTGKYKVVQAFYQSMDHTNMRMEVFTIASGAGSNWREIIDDPPYPPQRSQTAVSINGYMFWRIDNKLIRCLYEQPAPRAILHLSLDNEEFGITGLPDSLDPALDDSFVLDVLHGRELCLTACNRDETMITIWTLPIAEEGLENSQWERRYSIRFSGLCHPMALPPCSSGIILWQANTIYHYDVASSELTTLCEMGSMRYQGRRVRKWKNLFTFNVKPYTESLVGITNSLPLL